MYKIYDHADRAKQWTGGKLRNKVCLPEAAASVETRRARAKRRAKRRKKVFEEAIEKDQKDILSVPKKIKDELI